ncbi:hypothetical protein B0H16DRAFT_572533 [Mycena metata]|uniref:C3H1-type domain-containing protein n=1 Tax=Mycena metata TaxID=1033252 RepID=A0AAD7NHD6_9AGAR|nr:hypothetical protein B0H16DRAFT_572533 [Mycena metata]
MATQYGFQPSGMHVHPGMVVTCNSTGCVHAQTCPLFYWHSHPPAPAAEPVSTQYADWTPSYVEGYIASDNVVDEASEPFPSEPFLSVEPSASSHPSPSPSNETPPTSGNLRASPKSVPCLFFQRGKCSRGKSCPFSHTVPNTSNIKNTINASMRCKFFIQGSCRKGDSCPYFHDAVDPPSTSPSTNPSDSEVPPETPPVSELDEHPLVVKETTEPPRALSSVPSSPECAPLRASVLSVAAAVFEPCKFSVTGRCVRGDSCMASHGEAVEQAYSPIPSVSPLIPDPKGEDGGWIQFSPEFAQASTYDPSFPSFFPRPHPTEHDLTPTYDISFPTLYPQPTYHVSGHVGHDPTPESRTLRVCEFFARGTCRRGNACPHVHDIRAQNPAPEPELAGDDYEQSATEVLPRAIEKPPAPMAKLCRYQGNCRKGNKCPFRHDSYDRPPSSWSIPVTASQPVAEEAGWLDETDDWVVDQQAASKWGIEDAVAVPEPQSHAAYSKRTSKGPKSNWRQEIDDRQWQGEPQIDEQVQGAVASWFEETEAGWMQQTEDNPDWSVDQQAAGKWVDEPEAHRKLDVADPVSPEKDLGAEQSWDTPWPDAVPSSLPPPREYCKFFGQGHCSKGDNCRFLHVAQEEAEIEAEQDIDDLQEDQDFDLDLAKAASIPLPPDPDIPPRSLYHCMVRFGDGAVPEQVVTSFDSVGLILSNYPPGLAHADLVQLVEPYGVVNNTTFRLSAGGVRAHIEFEEPSQAAKARSNLNGLTMEEMVLQAHLDSVASVSGTIDGEIGRQVKLVWDAPSVSAWAFYPTVGTAKEAEARLNGITYGARTITVEYWKKSKQPTVRLTGLPLTVNQDDLRQVCVGSSSVSLNSPNYREAQNENILAYLADFGPVDSFEVLATDPSQMKIVGFARFRSVEAAANAVQGLKDTTHNFLGKGRISAQPIFHSKYDCSRCPLAVIREELEQLHTSASDSACTLRLYDDSSTAHVYGRQNKSVAVIRKAVEDLLFGSDLEVWDPYFDTSSSEKAFKRINDDDSIHIRPDRRRRVLRVWGNREKAERQVTRLLKHVQAERHTIRMEDDLMPALIKGGLKSLHDEFGVSKILLDVRSQTLTVLGDIKTEVDARLQTLTPTAASSRKPRGCCLCFAEAVKPVELDCEHIYCSACLQLLLCPVPGLDFVTPTCVAEAGDQPNSPCLSEIPISLILPHLTNDNQEQLFESSLLSFVRSHSEYRFCPSGCPVIYRISFPGTIFACPECYLDLCASCAVPVHPGLTCETLQENASQ